PSRCPSSSWAASPPSWFARLRRPAGARHAPGGQHQLSCPPQCPPPGRDVPHQEEAVAAGVDDAPKGQLIEDVSAPTLRGSRLCTIGPPTVGPPAAGSPGLTL